MNDILNDQNEKNDCTRGRDRQDMIFAFHVSFFAMCRLSSFPWITLEIELQDEESSEIITEILKQTCLHSLCRKTPPSVKYRRLFLSELIKRHEATTAEPLDELYEAFGEVLVAGDEPVCYKTYLLPSGDPISLSESVAIVSQGTTGLVTWEASLYLVEWALENPQVFTGRVVLELGSGAGLTGVAVFRSCGPRRYVFSDCHSGVLQRLRSNARLNSLPVANGNGGVCTAVSVEELDWAAVTEERLRELGAETVIAADVVYDPDVIGCLVGLLSKILRFTVCTDVYVSSTIRNPETYGSFKSQLESTGIRHQIIKGPAKPVFPYDRTTSIEMIKLYL